jgi:hypothetical protein
MSRRTSVFIQPSSHGSTIIGEKNNICIVIYAQTIGYGDDF